MTTHHIGRIVVGCLAAGLVAALGLVAGPVSGEQEHVITGAVLLAFASSWALLAAARSTRSAKSRGFICTGIARWTV